MKIPGMNPILDALGLGGAPQSSVDTRELLKFLQAAKAGKGPRNKYVDVGDYNIYMQTGPYGPAQEDYLNIANVSNKKTGDLPEKNEVRPEGERGPRGNFRDVMAAIEKVAVEQGLSGTYVEQIMNDFLPEVLYRYGYTQAPRQGERSMYKPGRRAGQMETLWRSSNKDKEGQLQLREEASKRADEVARGVPGALSKRLTPQEQERALQLAAKIEAGAGDEEDMVALLEIIHSAPYRQSYEEAVWSREDL